MSWIKNYELATSLDEAEARLKEPGWAILGGGNRLVANKPAEIDKLIDLLPLGLDSIEERDGGLRLEARVRLEELVQRDEFDGLLRAAALSLSHSVNLRNQMTVAGETAWLTAVSELQTVLLALDALVHRHGREPLPIGDYLGAEGREGVITALSLPGRDAWRHGFDRVAPADSARPLLIFAGAARVAGGKLSALRLVLGKLGPYPQRLEALEARLQGAAPAASAELKLTDKDRQGLLAVDDHNASADTKWRWAEVMLRRFLASLDGGRR